MGLLAAILLTGAAILVLGHFIDRWHQRCWFLFFQGDQDRARRWAFRVLAPGVILHEGAHLLMALVLGRKVMGWSLFDPKYDPVSKHWRLGQVVFAEADPWRNLLIGAAPLIAGPVVLLLLLSGVGARLPTSTDPAALLGAFGAAFAAAGWKAPLLLYAFMNLGTTVLVSPQDMRDLKPALFLGALASPVVLVIWLILPQVARGAVLAALTSVGTATLFVLVAMLVADVLALLALMGAFRLLYLRADRMKRHSMSDGPQDQAGAVHP